MPISKLSNLKKLLGLFALSIALATPTQSFANDIQAINQMFRKGDLNGALARANQVLAKNPKDAQVRFLKGLALADLNRANEAIQIFTSITEDYPELPEPYNNLAVLYASQGKYDAARNALEMAIRTHPSYATAHENLGDLYAKMASQAYDKALQIDGGNKTAQTKLALIKDMMSGQPRKAPAKPAVVAASTPATPVKSTPAASAAGTNSSNDLSSTVQSWAKAWASRDVDAYLAFYAPDFLPSSMNRDDWAAQRRERIANANNISVSLSDISVQRTSATRATVQFQQSYQSDKLKNTSRKTLEMSLIDGQWRILRESGR